MGVGERRYLGGFKAHRIFCHLILGSRVIKKKDEEGTTPESKKGSPEVNPPLKAVVFKSGYRVLTRF